MWCADGYYRAGTHAAEMAKTKGIRALQVEKQRKDAEEEQRRKQQVSRCSALPHMSPCSCMGNPQLFRSLSTQLTCNRNYSVLA